MRRKRPPAPPKRAPMSKAAPLPGCEPPLSAQLKWNRANSHKVKAQRAVHVAIRRGQIQRQPCEVCGDPKTDAHHPDYSKPLDVNWLCRRHHQQWHADRRASRS